MTRSRRRTRTRSPASSGQTFLYRLFDADGALLYVGISDRPMRRMKDHSRDKSWWDRVATLSAASYSTRDAAAAAEKAAVAAEAPLYNVLLRAPEPPKKPLPKRLAWAFDTPVSVAADLVDLDAPQWLDVGGYRVQFPRREILAEQLALAAWKLGGAVAGVDSVPESLGATVFELRCVAVGLATGVLADDIHAWLEEINASSEIAELRGQFDRRHDTWPLEVSPPWSRASFLPDRQWQRKRCHWSWADPLNPAAPSRPDPPLSALREAASSFFAPDRYPTSEFESLAEFAKASRERACRLRCLLYRCGGEWLAFEKIPLAVERTDDLGEAILNWRHIYLRGGFDELSSRLNLPDRPKDMGFLSWTPEGDGGFLSRGASEEIRKRCAQPRRGRRNDLGGMT